MINRFAIFFLKFALFSKRDGRMTLWGSSDFIILLLLLLEFGVRDKNTILSCFLLASIKISSTCLYFLYCYFFLFYFFGLFFIRSFLTVHIRLA